MLTLLTLLLVVTPAQVGSLHILVEPGDAVFLDGRQVGTSSVAAGGMMLENVPVGNHEIVVRTPAGGSSSSKVSVVASTTSTVTISSLGLRGRARGEDTTIAVQVTSDSPRCDLTVGADTIAGTPSEIRIEHVRAGRQKVTLACGTKRATGDVDVAPAKVITLQADLATGKIKTIHEEDRITSIYVPTVQDTIMRMDLPFLWKRAIAATLAPGVKPRSISRSGTLSVTITYIAANYRDIDDTVEALRERSEVQRISRLDYQYRRDGITVTVLILFRGA
jgi:hypothetical protein